MASRDPNYNRPPDEPIEDPKWMGMKIACSGLRREFKECVLNSPCVIKYRMKPSECFQNPKYRSYIPEECHQLRAALMECKRSQLDNRKRFRGKLGY